MLCLIAGPVLGHVLLLNNPVMMNAENSILGCFVSGPALYYNATEDQRKASEDQGSLFRSYIWGPRGISDPMKSLQRERYGEDMQLILFQFYLNPLPEELQYLKPIENYRKSEKSIGVPIIVTNENFYNKAEEDRKKFLENAILEKMNLLAEVVKQKKLDTKVDLLREDLRNVLTEHLLMM